MSPAGRGYRYGLGWGHKWNIKSKVGTVGLLYKEAGTAMMARVGIEYPQQKKFKAGRRKAYPLS